MPSVRWINSWWWAEELPETRRVSCLNKFGKLVHMVGFIIKKNDNLVWFICPKPTVQENCTLLSYYATSSGNSLATFLDTNTCCVTAQKSAVLIHFTVEAWNHKQQKIKVLRSVGSFTSPVPQYWSEEETNTKLLYNKPNRHTNL